MMRADTIENKIENSQGSFYKKGRLNSVGIDFVD
jgi:hypothetical protein